MKKQPKIVNKIVEIVLRDDEDYMIVRFKKYGHRSLRKAKEIVKRDIEYYINVNTPTKNDEKWLKNQTKDVFAAIFERHSLERSIADHGLRQTQIDIEKLKKRLSNTLTNLEFHEASLQSVNNMEIAYGLAFAELVLKAREERLKSKKQTKTVKKSEKKGK